MKCLKAQITHCQLLRVSKVGGDQEWERFGVLFAPSGQVRVTSQLAHHIIEGLAMLKDKMRSNTFLS